MQPSYGILGLEVEQTFEEGRWEELERLYREILAKDSSDAKTAFRLANLLAYQERYRESLPLYDTAWSHGWPGALALANKGVALACLGETRAAFKAFSDAWKHDEHCRPALYNLGVLCKKVGDEGSLPAVIVDLGLGAQDKTGSALEHAYFEKISWPPPGQDSWGATDPSERPLFLWLGDLKPGFGFEPIKEIVNVSEAYELYEEGQTLLKEERWEEAISKLEAAADLHPKAFADRIKAPRTEAQAAIARSHFAEIRRLWEENDFDGATQVFEELLAQGASLPDRAFADVIVESGIHELTRRIRSHKPKDGWEALQKLITSARQRVGENGGPADSEEAEAAGEATASESGEDAAPGEDGEGQRETSEAPPKPASAAATPPAGRASFDASGNGSGEHIRSVCSGAWSKQINHLLNTGDYESAIDLLEFPDIEWFAGDELPRWRQRVYTAKAEILRAKGRDFFERGDWPGTAACWQEGREAALQAADPRVVDSLDGLIAELLDAVPKDERDEIRRLFQGRDDRKDLRRLAKELEVHPGDPRLLKRRAALVGELLSRAEDALEARQWTAAQEIVDEILAAEPAQTRAGKLRRRAKKGFIDQRLEQAQEALDRGQTEKAEELCAEIAEIHPQNQGIGKIRRAILAADAAKSRAKQGPSPYDKAYLAYLAAREAANAESALNQALAMKKLDPDAPQTREALAWVPGAYVRSLQVQLERDRTAETANGLLEKLKLLFYLQPKFGPARELSRELRQVTKDYSDKKRQASYKKLGEAEDALLDGRPEDALEALRAVREPDLAEEVEEKRSDALAMLREQLEHLLASPSEDDQKKAEALLKVCQKWDPEFVVLKKREIQEKEEEISEEEQLDLEVARLAALLRQHPVQPFRALRELDREVRTLDLAGSEVRTRRRREIHALRRRARRAMTPLVRLVAWLYDRYYSTELPEPNAPETAREGRGRNR